MRLEEQLKAEPVQITITVDAQEQSHSLAKLLMLWLENNCEEFPDQPSIPGLITFSFDHVNRRVKAKRWKA